VISKQVKEMARKTETLIRLDPEVKEMLEQLSLKSNLSLSNQVAQLIKEEVQKQKDPDQRQLRLSQQIVQLVKEFQEV
jgi:predicted DNA-binding protein